MMKILTIAALAATLNCSAEAVGGGEVSVKMLADEMTSRYPTFRKLGAVSPNGEASPFVFGEKLYRMELSDPTRGLDFADPRICSEIREAETGRLVSKLAAGCYYTAAYIEGGRVYVTGTRIERRAEGKAETGGTILLFESDDLVNWASRELLTRPGWRFFNTSLTKGPEGYVMAVESNHPKHAGVPFTMFFATSKDLQTWTFMDDSRAFPKNWYAGGPFLIWRKGWYYLSLVTELPCQRYCTYLYRTRDFATWEVGRYNPFMVCSEEDRRISPHAHSLDAARRAKVGTAFICSLADVEMCDYDGKTYIGYGVGDQQGYYHWAEAWYDGPMDELLENFFR